MADEPNEALRAAVKAKKKLNSQLALIDSSILTILTSCGEIEDVLEDSRFAVISTDIKEIKQLALAVSGKSKDIKKKLQ